MFALAETMYLYRTLGELLRMHSGCFCYRSNNVWFWKEQGLVSFAEMKCQKCKHFGAHNTPLPFNSEYICYTHCDIHLVVLCGFSFRRPSWGCLILQPDLDTEECLNKKWKKKRLVQTLHACPCPSCSFLSHPTFFSAWIKNWIMNCKWITVCLSGIKMN